jgi:hypothetical protein
MYWGGAVDLLQTIELKATARKIGSLEEGYWRSHGPKTVRSTIEGEEEE